MRTIMIEWFHPGILFIFGAILIPFFKGKARQIYIILIPALAIFAVASMSDGQYWSFTLLGREIILGKVDKLSICFAYVFTIMAFIGMVYALHIEKIGEHIAAYLYVGSSLGVVFAGDYFTIFIFWEIMAFASAYLVFARGEKKSIDAGFRYLMIHIARGLSRGHSNRGCIYVSIYNQNRNICIDKGIP